MRASCCICSDIFDEWKPISAIHCGHVYHTDCLMVWIGDRKTCPICRTSIKPDKIFKLFFDFNSNASANSSILENNVADLNARLIAKEAELRECKKEKEAIRLFVKDAEKKAADLQQTAYYYESEIVEMRLKIKEIPRLESKVKKLEQMTTALSNDLQLMNNVQTVVYGTKHEVEKMLQECGDSVDSAKQMATYCSVLKRELEKVMFSKNELLELNSKLKMENARYASKILRTENNQKQPADNSSYKYIKSKKLQTDAPPRPDSSRLPQKTAPVSCKVSDSVVDNSPLTAPFGDLKFSLHIGPSSSKSVKHDKLEENRKDFTNFSCAQRDDNSIIRTGYNGLGGHTNFINVAGTRSLKRKL